VNLVLLRSNIFIRNARKIVKKHPSLAQNIQETLALSYVSQKTPTLVAG
jgi:hypothetical protein